MCITASIYVPPHSSASMYTLYIEPQTECLPQSIQKSMCYTCSCILDSADHTQTRQITLPTPTIIMTHWYQIQIVQSQARLDYSLMNIRHPVDSMSDVDN